MPDRLKKLFYALGVSFGALQIEACQMRMESQLSSHEIEKINSCHNVKIEEIYLAPWRFEAENICTEGVIVFLGSNSFAVIPEGVSREGPWDTLMYISISSNDLRRTLSKEGIDEYANVKLSGQVSYDAECWRGSAEKKSEATYLLCAPVQKPIFMALNYIGNALD